MSFNKSFQFIVKVACGMKFNEFKNVSVKDFHYGRVFKNKLYIKVNFISIRIAIIAKRHI